MLFASILAKMSRAAETCVINFEIRATPEDRRTHDIASVFESDSFELRYSVSAIESPKGLSGLRTASLAVRIFWASGTLWAAL